MSPRRSWLALAPLVLCLSCAHAPRVRPDAEEENALSEARRLHDAGKETDAVALLEKEIARKPSSLKLGNTARRFTRQLILEERSIAFLRNLSTQKDAP